MDILSVLEGFLQIIPATLIDGYTVDLGDFGYMWLTAKSDPTDTEEDFNATQIEGVKVIFRPGKLFRNELQDAEFKKIGNSEE
jgi:hypothetical protein